MNKTWQALAGEVGLAAEHLAIGATMLSKAKYAQDGYYRPAFFALTIGVERASKLALLADHALENGGAFPQNSVLRGYGHDLTRLLQRTDKIAERHKLQAPYGRLPTTEIHQGIIRVLADFANNITRYYNLDVVTGDARAGQRDDPIRAWYDLVVVPVLREHYGPKQRGKHHQNAALIEELIGRFSLVRHDNERGEELNNVFDVSFQTDMAEFAKPYVRMYIMQLARFLGLVLSELGCAAYNAGLDTVPHLCEFFGIFNKDDRYFREKTTWSIYPARSGLE